ncbi:tryptophan--tRNA ligase [Pacificibacter sp. AS14]|uniref:tryptophan--tRNA ligase n=1 Tax=Pacificibacter sp. AS14 TaxID=3135785 RepID=UPI00317D1362
MDKPAFTPRVFSGIKPSGGLTLGNYLGAIKRFVDMQGGEFETIYCVVDMHAITVWQDPKDLHHATREVAAGYLASGIDPDKSILFNQSRVSAHAELGWLFNCVARVGWMNRMTQFKDKAGENTEGVSLGLYAYPALMAADILTYHATHVPVGDDQKQHVELTRDIANKFNHDYKVDFFPETTPVIEGPAMRVMNLRDGTKKMSKSGESDMERINMTDGADLIAKKFKKAKTDPDGIPETLEGLISRPEARNLVNIYAALNDMTNEAVVAEYAGAGWGRFKPALADLAVEKLSPISTEMQRYMNDPAEIDRIMAKGAAKAKAIADPILDKTFDIMGFVR